MTEEKAQAQRALHWLPNEDLAEAQDAAAQDAAEGSWTLAVDADERDMEKAEMLRRIQRLETTEDDLSDRVSNLEAKLQEVMDRLELLHGGSDGRSASWRSFNVVLNSDASVQGLSGAGAPQLCASWPTLRRSSACSCRLQQ